MAKSPYSTLSRRNKKKIRSLSSGTSYPLDVEYIIRLWAEDLEELSAKTSAIKAALNLMESTEFWEGILSTQSINLLTQSVPGWIFGQYKAHALYAESEYLAAIIPFSSTFTGHLKHAEALYDGDNGNLIGLRNFIGSTPQHGSVFGMSGSQNQDCFLNHVHLNNASHGISAGQNQHVPFFAKIVLG